MMSDIVDEQNAMKANCKDKDVGYDDWPDVAIDGIPMKTQRQRRSNE